MPNPVPPQRSPKPPQKRRHPTARHHSRSFGLAPTDRQTRFQPDRKRHGVVNVIRIVQFVPTLPLLFGACASLAAQLEGPGCDDPEVIEFVAEAFDTVQELETKSGVALASLFDIHELGAVRHASGNWRQTRACSARAKLSSGETIPTWHRIILPTTDDAIGYRVKVCFAKYDPLSGGDCRRYDAPPSP